MSARGLAASALPRPEWLIAAMAVALFAAALPWALSGWPTDGDLPSAIAEVQALAAALRRGELVAWYDGPNLGYPLVVTYQPLPLLTAAAIVAVVGDDAAPVIVMSLAALAWAVTPAAWWLGARWLGLTRGAAIAAGLLAPMVLDPDGFGLGLRTLAGSGLVSQVWAGALLPLAWGGLVRTARDGTGVRSAAAALAALILCHPVLSAWCLFAVTVHVSVERTPHRARALWAVTAAALLTAWWWIPMVALLDAQGGLLAPRPVAGHHDWRGVLAALARGELTDAGRTPWVGALALAGLVVGRAAPGRGAGRALIVTVGFTVAALAGGLRWLPGGVIEPVRLVAGVHACAIVSAAVAVASGAAAIARWSARHHSRGDTIAAVGVGALAVSLIAGRAWTTQRGLHPGHAGALGTLAAELAHREGRIMTLPELRTRTVPYLATLPALARRPPLLSMSRGFHDSPSTAYVIDFEPSSAGLALYGVVAIVARGVPPELPSGLSVAWRDDTHALVVGETPPTRFHLVRTTPPLRADRSQAVAVINDIAPRLFARGVMPVVCRRCDLGSIDGADPGAAQAALMAAAAASTERPRPLIARRAAAAAIDLGLDVPDTAGPPWLLLVSAAYHPWWRARVDGRPAPVVRAGPAMLGLPLASGRHEVELRFAPPLPFGVLALASLAGGLLALVVLRRRTGARPRPI